jgi:hypothetical protein
MSLMVFFVGRAARAPALARQRTSSVATSCGKVQRGPAAHICSAQKASDLPTWQIPLVACIHRFQICI